MKSRWSAETASSGTDNYHSDRLYGFRETHISLDSVIRHLSECARSMRLIMKEYSHVFARGELVKIQQIENSLAYNIPTVSIDLSAISADLSIHLGQHNHRIAMQAIDKWITKCVAPQITIDISVSELHKEIEAAVNEPLTQSIHSESATLLSQKLLLSHSQSKLREDRLTAVCSKQSSYLKTLCNMLSPSDSIDSNSTAEREEIDTRLATVSAWAAGDCKYTFSSGNCK